MKPYHTISLSVWKNSYMAHIHREEREKSIIKNLQVVYRGEQYKLFDLIRKKIIEGHKKDVDCQIVYLTKVEIESLGGTCSVMFSYQILD